MIVLSGYLLINIITGWVILSCNRKEIPPPALGKTTDLSFHPLGHQHPHGNSVYLCRSSGTEFLAHGHYGAPVSGFRLCLRSRPVDYLLPDLKAFRAL